MTGHQLNGDRLALTAGRYTLTGGITRHAVSCLVWFVRLPWLRSAGRLPGLPDHKGHEQKSDEKEIALRDPSPHVLWTFSKVFGGTGLSPPRGSRGGILIRVLRLNELPFIRPNPRNASIP